MEKFTEELLKDELVLSIYGEIDKVNKFSSSHGIKHIKNTIGLAEQIEDVFNLSKRDRLMIETSLVLHDIGQVEGRIDHGKRSMIFAKNFLSQKNIFSDKELKIIYSAIENHDECVKLSKLKTNIAWFVNLIDKLDFSKNRLEDSYREKYKYSIYEEIDHLDFDLKDNVFNIDIKLIDGSKAKIEDLFDRVLFSKATYIFENFCDKFNLIPKMNIENKLVDMELLNFDNVMIN